MVQKDAAVPDRVTEWAKRRMPFLFTTETRETFLKRITTFLSPYDRRYRDVELAYDIAEDEFKGVVRAGGADYFGGHLRPVALILTDYLWIRDHELIIAALLHDIIEDMGWTKSQIQKLFGNRVAYIVAGVSEPKPEDCGGLKEIAERLFHNSFDSLSRDCFIVKNPDRLQNLITLGARPRAKQIAKVAETEEHYLPQARKHLILLPELRELVQIWKEQLA